MQPSEIQATKIAAKKIGAQRNQRSHPASAIIPVVVGLNFTFQADNHELSCTSYTCGLAWQNRLEMFEVDQFLRQAKMEFSRAPICHIDKRVEILFQKFERIGFQVAPLVMIRKTRGGNYGARGDGTKGGHLGLRQCMVNYFEVVILVFAHLKPSAPMAVCHNPFRACSCWLGQPN